MGYTTDFTGSWAVTPKLSQEHIDYLLAFSETRRMRRDAALTAMLPDPIREKTGLAVGEQGGYYVGAWEKDSSSVNFRGQGKSADLLDYNNPPDGQPGLWCQWVPTEDGRRIIWDGGEKFYNYIAWIEYLNIHFLIPWGYKLNGTVEWQGEDLSDVGRIELENSKMHIMRMVPTWEEVNR